MHDCLNCQTSKSMPNLLAPQQPFLEMPPNFNHRFLMTNLSVLRSKPTDRCLHTLRCSPSINKMDPANELNVSFDQWIVKFGIPDILVTDNRKEYFNGEFTYFCREYKIQFKPRTPYAPWSNALVENSDQQPNTYLRFCFCF